MTRSHWFDLMFRDVNGEIVIAQPPNVSLSTWIGASLLQVLVPDGPIHTALEIIAVTAIIIWAIQELSDGANYFRRGLGLVVLLTVCLSKLDLLLS